MPSQSSPTLSPLLSVCWSMEQKRKGIGLAIVSWSRSGMQPTLLMSSMGLHTPLCGSLIKVAVTESLMTSRDKHSYHESRRYEDCVIVSRELFEGLGA